MCRRGLGYNILESLNHLFDMACLVVEELASPAPIAPKLPLVLRMVKQMAESPGQIERIVRIHFNTTFTVNDCLPEAALIRVQDRQPRRHRFKHDQRLPLLLNAWKNEQVGLLEAGLFFQSRDLTYESNVRFEIMPSHVPFGRLTMKLMRPSHLTGTSPLTWYSKQRH